MVNRQGINLTEPGIEVFHVAGGEGPVVESECEFKFCVNGGKEIVLAAIGDALHGVGEDVAEGLGFGRMADTEILGFTTTEVPFGVGVMVDAAGLLEEELMAVKDASDGGDGKRLKSLGFAEGIEKDLDLFFAQAGMLKAQVADEFNNGIGNDGGADVIRAGGRGGQGGEFAVVQHDAASPAGDDPAVSSEGFDCGGFTELIIEIQNFLALLGNFTLLELAQAMEHIIRPPIALNFIKQPPQLHG